MMEGKRMNLGLLIGASVAAMMARPVKGLGGVDVPARVGVKLNTPMGQPPRRLSTDKNSPHFDAAAIRRILVRFDGVYRDNDCHAYDADEGWIDVRIRDSKGRFKRGFDGSFKVERKFGKVESEWKAVPQVKAAPPAPVAPPLDLSVAATEKRARKAAKALRDAEKQEAKRHV